jgi:hypothetical protein
MFYRGNLLNESVERYKAHFGVSLMKVKIKLLCSKITITLQ